MTQEEVRNILSKIRANYPQSFTKMTPKEGAALFEVWCEGLADVEKQYADMALRDVLYSTTDKFAPTIGQFLYRVREHKAEYERKHPVIRNSWEITDEGSET